MYRGANRTQKIRQNEVTIRFSDEELAYVESRCLRTGEQRAVLCRELIMNGISHSDDPDSTDFNLSADDWADAG